MKEWLRLLSVEDNFIGLNLFDYWVIECNKNIVSDSFISCHFSTSVSEYILD